MDIRRTLLTRHGLLIMLASFIATGCLPKAPVQSELMKQAENVNVSRQELRLKVHNFTDGVAGRVEHAADQIIEESSDPTIRRNAQLWKMRAIPEFQKAAFQFDPLAGYIDVTTFCAEMRQFFEEGNGRDLFGPWQEIAVSTSQRLEQEAYRLGESATVSGQVPAVREFVAEWVANHPLEDLYFNRDSTRFLLAEKTGRKKGGVGQVMGSLDQGIGDLSDRLTLYAEHLPRQARWQAELFLYDTLREIDLDEIRAEVDGFADSLDRIATTVELTPALVTQERQATLASIDELAANLVAAVDRQRLDTIEALLGERVEILRAIQQERIAIIEAVRRERLETVEQAEAIVRLNIDSSLSRAEGMLEGLFWRVLLLGVLMWVGLTISGIIIVRSARAGRPR